MQDTAGKDQNFCHVDGCYNIRTGGLLCHGHLLQRRAGEGFTALFQQHREPWDYPHCSFGPCDRGAWVKGLCASHYQQSRRGDGTLKPLKTWTRKRELACKYKHCTALAIADYCDDHASFEADNERTGRSYFSCGVSHCPLTFTKFSKTGICKNHGTLARKYGLTPQTLIKVYANYSCRICASAGPRLHIDHDHSCCPSGNAPKCGKCVRGLLCMHCNHLIGNAFERIEVLEAAIAYLRDVNSVKLGLIA